MIHTVDNFYNKLAEEIREIYFSGKTVHETHDANHRAANYAIELFNNGCLTYRQLVGRLAKSCNATTAEVHSVVERHIVSFGSYRYKPSKPIKTK